MINKELDKNILYFNFFFDYSCFYTQFYLKFFWHTVLDYFSTLSGTLWYILAVMSSENANMHKTVMLFEFMLGPNFVLGNLYRCLTVFLFLAIAMILKTVFTIGLGDTMHYFTVCHFASKINLHQDFRLHI